MAKEFPPTPEHDKLKGGREDEHRHVVMLLNWLEETGHEIGKHVEHGGVARFVTISPRDVVADYFEIDTKAWDREDRAVLEYARSLND